MKAVDDSLAALNVTPDWFVTSKMIKKPLTALYGDNNILYFNEDSGDFVFSCNEMGILSTDLNNIILDDSNYDEHDTETFIHIRLLAWYIKLGKRKPFKKRIKWRINGYSVAS